MSELYDKEYLYREPSWLSRSGNMVIAGFLFLVFILSLLINYNETINAEVLVTSENPPVHLISKKKGQVSVLNIPPNNLVKENDVLAVLQNTSNASDIFKLKGLVKDSLNAPIALEDLMEVYPDDLNLEPNIQESYKSLITKHTKLLLYDQLDQNKMDLVNIGSKLEQKKSIVLNKQKQLSSQLKSSTLSYSKLQRNQQLFKKGVISKQEFEVFEQEYIDAQNDVRRTREEINELYMDTLDLKNRGFRAKNTDISENTLLYFDFILAKKELLSKIREWEEMNVLVAPTNGVVSIFDIWTNNQEVREGEKLFTIVPEEHGNIIGRCKVPLKNSAGIEKGDQVVIKLDNYPSEVWGNLKGRVWKLSQSPKNGRQSYYSVYIKLENLTTSYGKEISFRQEMYGSARIILEETSLFERIFYELRQIWTDAKF